jgi:hypothetical protein
MPGAAAAFDQYLAALAARDAAIERATARLCLVHRDPIEAARRRHLALLRKEKADSVS